MILTYRYRLKDKNAKALLRRHSWAVNQVWNYCVATQRKVQEIWKRGSRTKWPSRFDLQKLTVGTSTELGIHAHTVQNTGEQFAKSRDAHKKCPRFRSSSGSRRSLGWVPFQTQSRQISGNSVTYLGKTFRFFGEKRRPLPTVTKGGAFVEDAQGKWYVCFHVEVAHLPTGTGEVGIDLGLKTLVTTSGGEKFENPREFSALASKLATAQRSHNRTRAKAIYAKIADVRKDHLHKVSAKLAAANRLIVVGNVSPTKLAKTRMAKSVMDASWGALKNMLEYKVRRHQATFLEVNESFTTQTCSFCGDKTSEGRPKGITGLGIREWVCSNCGMNHDRDVNAAKNILALGRSATPLVEGSLNLNCLISINGEG